MNIEQLSKERKEELQFLARNGYPINLVSLPVLREIAKTAKQHNMPMDDMYTISDLFTAGLVSAARDTPCSKHNVFKAFFNKMTGNKGFSESDFGEFSDVYEDILMSDDAAFFMNTMLNTGKIDLKVNKDFVLSDMQQDPANVKHKEYSAGEKLSILPDRDTFTNLIQTVLIPQER